MLDLLLILGAVGSVIFAFLQGEKKGKAETTVENFEEVAERVRKSRAIRRALTPGSPEFDELRQRYSRK